MSGLGKSLLLYDRVESLAGVFKAIDEVTAEDLMRLADQYLDPAAMSRMVYT